MKHGAAVIEVLSSISVLGVLGAVVLQVSSSSTGLTPGEAIQGGFSLIVVGLVWMVHRRQDQREKAEHERETVDSKKRQEIHGRIDSFMQSQTGREVAAAERYARLEARSDTMREDIIGIGVRIDGVGSKISNQVEKALESRATEYDRRFAEMNAVIDRRFNETNVVLAAQRQRVRRKV